GALMTLSPRQHDAGVTGPGEPDAIIPGDRPLDQARDIGGRGLHHEAAVELDFVDRKIPEISDVAHSSGDTILNRRRRLFECKAYLLGPQRDPDGVAWPAA